MSARAVGEGRSTKKNLIEASLAHQFRGQGRDIVGGGDHQDLGFPLRHPGEEGSEHALGRARFIGPCGEPLLDFIDPQHTGAHDLGRLEGRPEVALGLAMKFVIQRAEVQAQQGKPENPSRSLCGQALTATLDADEQDALGWIQALGAFLGERQLSLGQPDLEVSKACHIVESCGVVLVGEHTIAVQQLVLRFHDAGDVVRGDRPILIDGISGEALGVRKRQPGEISNEELQGLGIHLDLPLGVLLAVLVDELVNGGLALFGARELHLELGGERLDLGGQLDVVADQQHADPGSGGADGDVFQQSHVHRIGQERMEVEQRVDAGTVSRANLAQDIGGLGDLLLGLQIQVEALQAVGDRPAQERAVRAGGALDGELHQQFEKTLLIRGLYDHNGRC